MGNVSFWGVELQHSSYFHYIVLDKSGIWLEACSATLGKKKKSPFCLPLRGQELEMAWQQILWKDKKLLLLLQKDGTIWVTTNTYFYCYYYWISSCGDL